MSLAVYAYLPLSALNKFNVDAENFTEFYILECSLKLIGRYCLGENCVTRIINLRENLMIF
jgi:heme/copper-type cytochrome/quinol oxidase subunit 1